MQYNQYAQEESIESYLLSQGISPSVVAILNSQGVSPSNMRDLDQESLKAFGISVWGDRCAVLNAINAYQ